MEEILKVSGSSRVAQCDGELTDNLTGQTMTLQRLNKQLPETAAKQTCRGNNDNYYLQCHYFPISLESYSIFMQFSKISPPSPGRIIGPNS